MDHPDDRELPLVDTAMAVVKLTDLEHARRFTLAPQVSSPSAANVVLHLAITVGLVGIPKFDFFSPVVASSLAVGHTAEATCSIG